MPSVEPVDFARRAGFVSEPAPLFEVSWYEIPFDDYEGMTQQQMQDSIAPYTNHGKGVAVTVPKGWRRVEGGTPGQQFYVHMTTGAVTKFPKEVYNTKKECWMDQDGVKIPEAMINMDPADRILMMAGPSAASKKDPSVVAVPKALPKVEKVKEVEKVEEKPAAIEAAPAEEAAEEAAIEDVPAPLPSEPPLPVALMFPGQGSQYVKMLSDVKELPPVADMLDKAKTILGYDILEICLKGPESKLEETRYCQPAMFIGGLAAVEKMRAEKPERVDRCQAVAGLSLGEYTALCVAGVFTFEEGLKLVKVRGEAMQEANEATDSAMLSVAGLDEETLSNLCAEVCSSPSDVCVIANDLFPLGFSVAGTRSCIEKLAPKAQGTAGCLQSKILKTGGAYHTKVMEPAKAKLLEALKEAEKKMKPPRCDVYMNVTGKRITPATSPAEIIPMMADQLTSRVNWHPGVKEMIKDGVTEFYECGPMKQLKAMMKRINAELWKTTVSYHV
jgi:[acyl-carrier-protein] S-malonyltransferase